MLVLLCAWCLQASYTATGQRAWWVATSGQPKGGCAGTSPAIGLDGTLYVSNVLALNGTTGATVWNNTNSKVYGLVATCNQAAVSDALGLVFVGYTYSYTNPRTSEWVVLLLSHPRFRMFCGELQHRWTLWHWTH
jgi:hypothetical protein